jgi:hypothetical protein
MCNMIMILEHVINTKLAIILKQVFTFRFKIREYFDFKLLEMALHYRGSAFKTSSARCVLRDEHGINDNLQGKGPLLTRISGTGCNRFASFLLSSLHVE